MHCAHRRAADRLGRRRRVLRPRRRSRPGARRALRRGGERHHAAGAVLDADAVRSGRAAGRQLGQPLRLHQPGDRAPRPTAASRSRSRPARAPATGCRPAASSATCWCCASTTRRSASRRAPGARRRCRRSRWGRAHDPLRAVAPGRRCCSAASSISAACWCCRAPRPRTPIRGSRRSRRSTRSPRCRCRRPTNATLPFMDPAFAVAVCRYDLSGEARSSSPTPVEPGLHVGVVLYALRRRLLRHQRPRRRPAHHRARADDAAQRSRLPEDEEVTAADRLIVESPTPTGLVVLRALAPSRARCRSRAASSPPPDASPIRRGDDLRVNSTGCGGRMRRC